MKNRFEGTYYKHQKGGCTVSLIAGVSAGRHAFIQVIADTDSYYMMYPLSAYEPGETVRIGSCFFSADGIRLHIEEKGGSVRGEIRYTGLTPLRRDIMGPFAYLPMQCRHRVGSLHHRLEESVTVNGQSVDLTGGVGYTEGDSGTSFPKECLDSVQ